MTAIALFSSLDDIDMLINITNAQIAEVTALYYGRYRSAVLAALATQLSDLEALQAPLIAAIQTLLGATGGIDGTAANGYLAVGVGVNTIGYVEGLQWDAGDSTLDITGGIYLDGVMIVPGAETFILNVFTLPVDPSGGALGTLTTSTMIANTYWLPIQSGGQTFAVPMFPIS